MMQESLGKVYNPSVGKYFLLQCHTHNKQNFVVLVKNQKNINSVFKSICEKEFDDGLKIKSLFQIELVTPSGQLIELAEKHLIERQVKEFRFKVFYYLRHYFTSEDLPSIFEKCNNFQAEDGTYSSSDDEYHYRCINCEEKYRLIGYSPEEFYYKFFPLWSEKIDKKQEKPQSVESNNYPQLQFSKARVVQEHEELWTAAYGDSSGINCRHIIDTDEYDLDQISCGVLFYFVKLQEFELTELEEILNMFAEENKKIKERKVELFKERRKSEKEEQVKKILEIFNAK